MDVRQSTPISSLHNKPQPKPPVSDGIAAIAQSLAVGASKALPMTRQPFYPPDPNFKPNDGAPQKQTGVSMMIQGSSATASSAIPLSLVSVPSRVDLGPRQVMMVIEYSE